jgi:competence protein ComEA
MRKRFPYGFGHLFTLTKREQRGIAILLFILVILLVLRWLTPFLFPLKKSDFAAYDNQVKAFVRARKAMDDSLKLVRLQKSGKLTLQQARRLLHPFPFDPNQTAEKQWRQMGLSEKQTQTISHYLAKGGRFRRKEDLKKIRGLSDAEYTVLAPYVKISISSSVKEKPDQPVRITLRKTELNSADAVTLSENLKLPVRLSERIVKYRHLLGGFYSPEQLTEVYGLKKSVFEQIRKFLFIDTSVLRRLDVNHASFKQLLRHPYLDYSTVKKLVRSREKLHGFTDLRQVKTETGMPDTLWNKIRHYLYLRPFKN